MSKPQVTVNDIELDNGSWRKIIDQLAIDTSSTGVKTASIKFIIHAADVSELAERIEETREDFDIINPNMIKIYYDDDATTPIENINLYDGIHTGSQSFITIAPEHSTVNAVVCMLGIAASYEQPRIGGGAGGSSKVIFDGQVGDIVVNTIYNSGRILSKALAATFKQTFNPSKFGPVTITAVASYGVVGPYYGNAKFTVTGTIPAFNPGMKLTVSGSTNYDGSHEIAFVSGQDIITRTQFISNDAGTAVIGAVTFGEENYQLARQDLLTDYLKVELDGSRDTVTRLVLTGEDIKRSDFNTDESSGNIVTVLMTAEPAILDCTTEIPSIRNLDYTIRSYRPDKWSSLAGTKPVMAVISGQFTIDEDIKTDNVIHHLGELIETKMRDEVKTQLNTSSTTRLISKAFTSDNKIMTVDFEFVYFISDGNIIVYRYTTSKSTDTRYTAWPDSEGYHIVQRTAAPDDQAVTISVQKQSYDRSFIKNDVLKPSESGFTFLQVGETEVSESDEIDDEGNTIYDQAYSITFRRFRMRDPNIKINRPRITG